MGNLSCRGIGAGVDEESKQGKSRSRRGMKKSHHLHRALSSSSTSSIESSASSECSSSSGSRKSKSLIREASVEILPPCSDGITRLKLVISKQQVDGIVSGDYSATRLDFFDNLVTSLIKQQLQQSCS